MSNSFTFLEKEHLFYTIKEGDTLYKVANELRLDPLEIRHYHNIYAEIDDVIQDDFASHLKVLILQTEKDRLETKTKRDEAQKKVTLSNTNFNLVFRPEELKKEYQVKYTIENGENIDTMRQEMSIKRLLTKENDYFYFEIDTVSKLYLNGTEVDGLAVELAENTAQILYPLQIVVDDNGKWRDIYNFDAIQKRWEVKKQDLLEYYEGDTTDQYIAIVDKTLQSKGKLVNKLSSNWFLRAFFNGIHIDYTEKLEIEKNVFYPISTNIIEAQFLVKQKINERLDEKKRLIIEQKGILDDARSKIDFENGSEFPFHAMSNENSIKAKGSYEAKYFLDPNNHNVNELLLECLIEIEPPQKLKIEVSPIKAEKIDSITQSRISLLN
ncbi:hypothetical protein FNW52_09290 [Flavobacterium sp. ZT3R18]|uniref:hypothetical protein n=1 Tax=Flavobacterium sp. ZT3R18 TaxID=2594429 RepID=UPI00117B3389|nr:hypothetical protein [Flavobacterium sp. ZT3R18]TRX36209.1 hypothetical protein FNW52_09290 [Flavobacterium sp. ZT3R18]